MARVLPGWPVGRLPPPERPPATRACLEEDGDLHTREGAKAQISWTNITDATHVTPLNQLNGLDAMNKSYLPTLTNPPALACTGDGYQVGNINPAHDDDART